MTEGKFGNTAVTAIRWTARVFGAICGSFLFLLFFGYFLKGQAPSPGSLTPFAALGLVLIGFYALAMFLALKWERAGAILGAIVLGSFFAIMYFGLLPENGNVSGGLSIKGVLNPFFLALWLPILLYVTCWRLEKAD